MFTIVLWIILLFYMFRLWFFLCFSSVICSQIYEDAIRPTIQEITKCLPDTKKSRIEYQISKLNDLKEKILNALVVQKKFKKNSEKLIKKLENLDKKQILKSENIFDKSLKCEKKEELISFFENGFDVYFDEIIEFEKHLKKINKLLNKKREITVIDLIVEVALLQSRILKLSETFRMLSFLDFAKKNIKSYDQILAGLNCQLFELVNFVNELSALTENIRIDYLNLLHYGDCSGDQIAAALGITQKKKELIENY